MARLSKPSMYALVREHMRAAGYAEATDVSDTPYFYCPCCGRDVRLYYDDWEFSHWELSKVEFGHYRKFGPDGRLKPYWD